MGSLRSVQPEWCLALSLQQQSVLLLAARGPDGIPKSHPCKNIQRAYRGTVLVAAARGRCLKYGERADSFMSLDRFGDDNCWANDVTYFFDGADQLPHHFFMHLMHGAEVIGYHHPDKRFMYRWYGFYERCCKDLHLTPETEREMDLRLNDWAGRGWDEPASA